MTLLQLDGDLPADCAIRGLFEEMIIPAEDPAYMEDVVKKTLGSSFAGTFCCSEFVGRI